ncbi:MAG: PepSY domain-containing protein [Clostridia bacterium]
MKTIRNMIGVILMLSMCISCGMAELISTGIDEFSDNVVKRQNETGFLGKWGKADIESFVEILKSFGLYDPEELSADMSSWETAAHGLRYAYEQVWGASRTWSLEHQHKYAEFELRCGIRDSIIESFPNKDDLSFDDARTLAQQLIRDMGDFKNYNGKSIDFNALEESYHFWDYPEEGRTWVFEYYDIGMDRATFSVCLYNNGSTPQVDYYDSEEMYNVYTEWYYLRGLQPFHYWSVNDKYEFYQRLLNLYDRQMERYGVLPEIAKLVLQKNYICQQEGMIDETQATSLARLVLNEQMHLDDQTIDAMLVGISLCESKNGVPLYEIGFWNQNEEQYHIDIDAYTGQYVGAGLAD